MKKVIDSLKKGYAKNEFLAVVAGMPVIIAVFTCFLWLANGAHQEKAVTYLLTFIACLALMESMVIFLVSVSKKAQIIVPLDVNPMRIQVKTVEGFLVGYDRKKLMGPTRNGVENQYHHFLETPQEELKFFMDGYGTLYVRAMGIDDQLVISKESWRVK